ncbi:GNAT family N-acetyltransferase, partial [Rubrivirga sp.]|uniref:GNAT family N-acetyltransferase n=1 Tax=Rubrivirga sp. TaxID=1885344 RepID=UPI003C761041
AYARAFDLEAGAVATGDGTAAMPTLIKRRGPFRAAALPPLAPVWRPLLEAVPTEAQSHARTSSLDRLLTDLEAAADQLTLALGNDDLRPYTWADWAATPRSTYRLDLGGDLEAGFSTATRRTVRKEASAFEIIEDGALAGDAVRLMTDSYRRQGSDLGLEDDVVAGLAEAFVEAGLARIVGARRGSDLEAAIVVAHDGRTAFYWIAGSVPGTAMTVLVADTVSRLAADGLEVFDFCGANTPSIAEFKRRFGPSLAPAPIVRRVTNPALRLVDQLRS